MKRMAFVVLALMAGSAFADRIFLKSGTVLTGSGAVQAGEVVKFDSDDLGAVSLKAADIVSVETAEAKKIEVAALPVEEKPPETWHGSINIAAEADRGNTHNNNISVVGNLNRRWEKDRVNFDAGYYYSETGKTKAEATRTTDRWEVEGQHDHFWFERFYNYENARYERDAIAEIDGRLQLGVGLGYQWLDSAKWDWCGTWGFNQELGLAWIRNDYAEPDPTVDDGYASLRYAHHLTFAPKWNEGVSFFHNLVYLPQVDDFENYIIRSDVGFTTKLVLNWDLLCKIEWDCNSRPARGCEKNDFRYLVGLGYKW